MPSDTSKDRRVSRINVYCLSYPLKVPIKTVMGTWTARPAILVRVQDSSGASGWGEIWCNFPPHGAEYKTKLAQAVLPGIIGYIDLGKPFDTFNMVRSKLNLLALQAGEGGTADAIASGIDIAVHDLVARRSSVPLVQYLGGTPCKVKAYASGIDCRDRVDMIAEARNAGFEAFKLRVGFGLGEDRQALADIGQLIDTSETIALDVNQSWTLDDIATLSDDLRASDVAWVEEPIPVNSSTADWAHAARMIGHPLSGGENMRSHAEFDVAVASRDIQIVQPDVCKWGGLSETYKIATGIKKAGKAYYPHFLGSGVGLLASAHMLAAVNPDGLLETDVNENGLRDEFSGLFLMLENGRVSVPDLPGLGITPDLSTLRDYLVIDAEITSGGIE